MSHIFDALQRSEDERSKSDSPAPPEAAELLQRAERRAASKWETTSLHEQSDQTKRAEYESLFGPQAAQPGATLDNLVSTEFSQIDESPDIFPHFKSLQAAPVAQKRLVCLTDNESPAAEAFRLLGVRLWHLRRDRQLKKLLITSTIPQEGKSTVSANLACTLALRTQQRTLIVEGDLRRPSLSQIFGLGRNPGICECLRGERDLMMSIYHLDGMGLWILPAGSVSTNPLELLQSGRLSSLMDQLTAWFDWIIIDSPPVLPLADTSVWTRQADGVLLVTRQGITEKQQLQKGLEALESKKLIGALLNSSTLSAHGYYDYRQPASASADDK